MPRRSKEQIEKDAQEAKKAETLKARDEHIQKFQRDEYGLLKNVEYIFREDGSIDWKAMIPKEHIVFNEEWFEKNGKPTPDADNLAGVENPEEYTDQQLLVLLSGIKEVAKIRGLVDAPKKVWESNALRSVVSCRVEFIPNYESDMKPQAYEDVANATVYNTNATMHHFLEPIAANRAFVRAVRNALRIDIVGSDEMSTTQLDVANQGTAGTEPWVGLANMASKVKVVVQKDPEVKDTLDTFEKFQAFLLNKNISEAKNWNSWKDIPPDTIFDFLEKLQVLKEKEKK